MKPQIMVLGSVFNRNKINIDLSSTLYNKPAEAIWSSTEIEEPNNYYSEYIEFADANNIFNPKKKYYLYRFHVCKDAKIFNVDSIDAIKRLAEYSAYIVKYETRLLNFRWMRNDGYDAMRVASAMHLSRSQLGLSIYDYVDVNSWDVESTVFLNPDVISEPEFIMKGKYEDFYKEAIA